MKILSIETSCDETAMAIVETKGGLKNPTFKVAQNFVSSQIKIHRPFGGVVPNLAKREHAKNLPKLLRKIFGISKSQFLISKQILNLKVKIQNIDLIAVTVGPGLEPALYTGVNFAKDLAKKWNKPIIGVNHLEGHLYSFLLEQKRENSNHGALNSKQKRSFGFRILDLEFPAIALLVSGGHTTLLLMKDLIHWKKLGETRDDAVGEAFDKVAKMLGLSYPGGPELEKLAKKGNSTAIDFPRPMIDQKNYDFSFSGLKTAVLYYLRDQAAPQFSDGTDRPLAPAASGGLGSRRQNSDFVGDQAFAASETFRIKTAASLVDIAASFQAAAIDVLVKKTIRAVKEFKAKLIILAGGVAANKKLKNELAKAIENQLPNSDFKIPNFEFCTDNAAMIAAAGYINWVSDKKRTPRVNANLNL